MLLVNSSLDCWKRTTDISRRISMVVSELMVHMTVQESNGKLLKAVWQLLTGTIATGNIEMTSQDVNPMLTAAQQLGSLAANMFGRRRVLYVSNAMPCASISRLEIDNSVAEAGLLAGVEGRTYSAGQFHGNGLIIK